MLLSFGFFDVKEMTPLDEVRDLPDADPNLGFLLDVFDLVAGLLLDAVSDDFSSYIFSDYFLEVVGIVIGASYFAFEFCLLSILIRKSETRLGHFVIICFSYCYPLFS